MIYYSYDYVTLYGKREVIQVSLINSHEPFKITALSSWWKEVRETLGVGGICWCIVGLEDAGMWVATRNRGLNKHENFRSFKKLDSANQLNELTSGFFPRTSV